MNQNKNHPDVEKAIERTFEKLMAMPEKELFEKLREAQGGDISRLYEDCPIEFFEERYPILKQIRNKK